MLNECLESVELLRRIDQGVYDEEEYGVARAWVREHCVQGEDRNPEHQRIDEAEAERHGTSSRRWHWSGATSWLATRRSP